MNVQVRRRGSDEHLTISDFGFPIRVSYFNSSSAICTAFNAAPLSN
jgi:hypothetical protein